MRIHRLLPLIVGFITTTLHAQSVADAAGGQVMSVSLDSCRAMALTNNKQLRIKSESVKKAHYQNREAFAAYLPALDFAGGYMYNQKELSIFDSDQLLPTKTFDLKTQSYQFNLVKNPLTGEPIKGPDGQYVPETVALIPKEAMTYDIHNVFFGAVTLTQPIFIGGKIVAMNKLTHYAEMLAKEMHNNEAENVIYAVDAAYRRQNKRKNKKEKRREKHSSVRTFKYNSISALCSRRVFHTHGHVLFITEERPHSAGVTAGIRVIRIIRTAVAHHPAADLHLGVRSGNRNNSSLCLHAISPFVRPNIMYSRNLH